MWGMSFRSPAGGRQCGDDLNTIVTLSRRSDRASGADEGELRLAIRLLRLLLQMCLPNWSIIGSTLAKLTIELRCGKQRMSLRYHLRSGVPVYIMNCLDCAYSRNYIHLSTHNGRCSPSGNQSLCHNCDMPHVTCIELR